MLQTKLCELRVFNEATISEGLKRSPCRCICLVLVEILNEFVSKHSYFPSLYVTDHSAGELIPLVESRIPCQLHQLHDMGKSW